VSDLKALKKHQRKKKKKLQKRIEFSTRNHSSTTIIIIIITVLSEKIYQNPSQIRKFLDFTHKNRGFVSTEYPPVQV
jgi:hypothetical protein